MKQIARFFKKKNDKGQGMVEYGLILALISIVAVVALTSLGGKVNDKFEDVSTRLDSASGYTLTYAYETGGTGGTLPAAKTGIAPGTVIELETLPIAGLKAGDGNDATFWSTTNGGATAGTSITVNGNITVYAGN